MPRVIGKIRRSHPVELRDLQFLRANTDRAIKMTVPGPFTMGQQAQDDYYKDEEALALDYADAVNAEIKDLFAAGADVVQIDEPWMQRTPTRRGSYGLKALDRALDGVTGTTAVHLCFGYAAVVHDKPSRLFVSAGAEGCQLQQISIETAQPKLDLRGLASSAGEDHHSRRHRSVRHDHGDADRLSRRESGARSIMCRRTARRGAGLRHEISASRGGLRQDEGDGRRRGAGAARAQRSVIADLSPRSNALRSQCPRSAAAS